MTSLATSALLVGGGGLAAYLFLRPKLAAAALPAAGASAAHAAPVLDGAAKPGIVVVAKPSAPAAPAPTPTLPAIPPPTPTQISATPKPILPTETAKPVATVIQLAGKWGWPVPRWEGRAPVISDGYGSPRGGMKHAGVDLMFTRISSDPFPVGSPNGSQLFVMPDAWPAVAAADGVLWSAGPTPRGFAVVIDHGNVATFYQHLSSLMVPETKPPAKGTPRDKLPQIKAGQPFGVIGADPLDSQHLKHLHFELWPSGPSSAVDPAPLMKGWQLFEAKDVVPLFPSARNARRTKDPDFVHVEPYDRRFPGSPLNPPPSKPRKPRTPR